MKKEEWMFTHRKELLIKETLAQKKIRELLDKENIFYVREQPIFKEYTKEGYFMDLYVPYYQLDIEVDGRQHRIEDRYDKDIKKADFLWEDRIATLHLTNQEVNMMEQIDMDNLLERVPEKQLVEIERIKNQQLVGWENFYTKNDIDLERKIFLYSTENDMTYSFSNILELQRSIHYDCDKILNILEQKKRSNIFVSFNLNDLNIMIDKWKVRKNKNLQ